MVGGSYKASASTSLICCQCSGVMGRRHHNSTWFENCTLVLAGEVHGERTMSNESLFSPLQLGVLQVPNRIIMAPLTRMRAGANSVPTALNNPQSNPQNAMSYTTSANFGSPRGSVKSLKSLSTQRRHGSIRAKRLLGRLTVGPPSLIFGMHCERELCAYCVPY